jgi:starch synthase
MKVLFASAEYLGLTSVGGLGVATRGLVEELRRAGVDVEVVVPDYTALPLAGLVTQELVVPAFAGRCVARTGVHPVVGPVTLIDTAGLARPHPYVQADGEGWPDNDKRFFGFAAAVAALADLRRPDVLHLNDWHTGAVPAFLADLPPTVFTIHTLGYQGHAAPGWLLDLPHRRERYDRRGSCNPMAGAIATADVIVAVSPTYANEIRSAAGGNGLDDLLLAAGPRLTGIRNGIDTDTWNPQTDPALAVRYSKGQPAGKAACRAALCSELGLNDDGRALLVSIGRLVDQKGIDLLAPIVPMLGPMGARLVVLGAGDRETVEQLFEAAAVYPDSVVFRHGYDESLAHRLTAGGDVFVMPSRFEPCGLAQMQAMRYGTVPVVTDVGGLHDTVTDADLSAEGTGFVASVPSSLAVLDALHRAVRARGDRSRWQAIQHRGMATDWSWRLPAAEQHAIYRSLARVR